MYICKQADFTQPTQRRRKDVVKTSYFGLKDVLDWSEMEVATTFFNDAVKTSSSRRAQDLFYETSSRPLPGDILKTSKTSSWLFLVKAKDNLETNYGFSTTYVLNYLHITTPSLDKQTN